ncbi:MAG: galactonate dehydratase, partial [Actinobacteria bacterium]|nr:galactonate dehydratase [Actinomycetota bacterium]
MKITKISTTVINANMRNWVILSVFTDEPGLIGIGEASLEFQTMAVVGAIEDLAPLVIGQDPRDIEKLWQIMYRHPFFKGGVVTMTALSGIDQALWDISAKALEVPLWRILGGRARDRVRMYDHLGGGNSDAVYNADTVDEFAAKIKQTVADGFTAVKILAVPQSAPLGENAKLRHAEELMGAARDAGGPDLDIMIDFHGRTTAAMAIQYAKVLEPFRPFFLEEVVPPDQHEAMVRARRGINVPLAAGERLLTRMEFLPLLRDGLIDVAQPDVCHAGGITELRKISALCDTFGVTMAPHNPLGPVATMVNIHLALATSNFLIQEVMRADVPWRQDVFTTMPELKDGHILAPMGIGIGIEINESEAKKHPYQPVTATQWYHDDGS